MANDVAQIVLGALEGTGINLVGTCGVSRYDARAPAGFRAADLMPRARGVVVAASAGPLLWRALCEAQRAAGERWTRAHPLDDHVARLLDRADAALAHSRVGSRRFEARFDATPTVDFRALGELVGLGTMGPFGLLIHPEHGPWWALRAAWLVDADVPDAPAPRAPCVGCDAPCVGGDRGRRGDAIALATPEVRSRCVVGRASRYDEEQIAYHYDREATHARLRRVAAASP